MFFFIDFIKFASLPTSSINNTDLTNIEMHVAGWGCTNYSKKI